MSPEVKYSCNIFCGEGDFMTTFNVTNDKVMYGRHKGDKLPLWPIWVKYGHSEGEK